jgi:hypothetical protein
MGEWLDLLIKHYNVPKELAKNTVIRNHGNHLTWYNALIQSECLTDTELMEIKLKISLLF